MDLTLVPSMAATGTLMAPLQITVIGELFAVAIVFAFVLDVVKSTILQYLKMD
jgi:H+-transporting ATPase